MAVDLGDYTESLRREVTPPGSTLFADVSDDVFIGYLADAFWEARLDGFLKAWTADEDGLVTPITGTVDLPREQIAAVIIYAGIRVLRNRILNLNTAFRSKAGPVEYEVENSATMLVEMLKQLKATKDRLIYMETNIGVTDVVYLDAVQTRLGLNNTYMGGYDGVGNPYVLGLPDAPSNPNPPDPYTNALPSGGL